MPFANNNGINIHYKVEGQGPPLVLLHGGLTKIQGFYEFGYVEALKESCQLILIDLRGHGKSDKLHSPDQYSYSLFIDDIICVLDGLEIESFHLIDLIKQT